MKKYHYNCLHCNYSSKDKITLTDNPEDPREFIAIHGVIQDSCPECHNILVYIEQQPEPLIEAHIGM